MRKFHISLAAIFHLSLAACTGDVQVSSSIASSDSSAGSSLSQPQSSSSSPPNEGESSSSTETISSAGTPSSTNQSFSSVAVSSQAALPTPVNAFAEHFRPVVQQCVACHSDVYGVEQTPMFMHSNLALGEYELISAGKVEFSAPDKSRIVEKISNYPLHNCGATLEQCQELAASISAAIEKWGSTQDALGANAISPIKSLPVAYSTAVSEALAGERKGNPFIEYQFSNCNNRIIPDTSGSAAPVPLNMEEGVDCVGGKGLVIPKGSYASATVDNSKKIFDHVTQNHTLTVEVWAEAGVFSERSEAGAVVAYAATEEEDVADTYFDPTPNNFHVGAQLESSGINFSTFKSTDNFDTAYRLAKGAHNISFYKESIAEKLTHIVGVLENKTISLYVNGTMVSSHTTENVAGFGWREDFKLYIGKSFFVADEIRGPMEFGGIVSYAALYKEALTPEEIAHNAQLKPSLKNVLTFDLTHLTEGIDTKITLEARSLTNKGYVLSNPVIETDVADGIPVKGLRILVNERLNTPGQSFLEMDVIAANGRTQLAQLGTVLLSDNGESLDTFTLSFDQLGQHIFDRKPLLLESTQYTNDGVHKKISGIKRADKIHATFSEITGFSIHDAKVRDIYDSFALTLPTSSQLTAVQPSTQLVLANAAFAYCKAMVETPDNARRFFGDISLSDKATQINVTPLVQATYESVIARSRGDLSMEEYTSLVTPLLNALISDDTSLGNVGVTLCGTAMASAMVTTLN